MARKRPLWRGALELMGEDLRRGAAGSAMDYHWPSAWSTLRPGSIVTWSGASASVYPDELRDAQAVVTGRRSPNPDKVVIHLTHKDDGTPLEEERLVAEVSLREVVVAWRAPPFQKIKVSEIPMEWRAARRGSGKGSGQCSGMVAVEVAEDKFGIGMAYAIWAWHQEAMCYCVPVKLVKHQEFVRRWGRKVAARLAADLWVHGKPLSPSWVLVTSW